MRDNGTGTKLDLLPPVYAHVIDQHLLRKFRSAVGIPGPRSSYCEVEQDEERMVIHPFGSLGKIAGPTRCVEILVNVEANFLRLPFDGKHMKVIGKALAVRQRKRAADAVIA